MPAMKKPADRLQRRNKLEVVDVQEVARLLPAPAPPTNVSAELQDEWRALWGSELATKFDPVNHKAPLGRLFWLRHVERELTEQAMERPITFGSKDQEQLNPLLKHTKDLRAEIQQLEDRFGLNPMAYMKLGIATGSAQRSLDEMNQRILDRLEGATNDDDPRLAAVDTTTA